MLVLSRRTDETIVFPNLGITIHLVGLKAGTARIGVDAPRGVQILRGELVGTLPINPHPAGKSLSHELCNRLSRATLALHLAQRQRELGMNVEADASLAQALDALGQLDREWVKANVTEPISIPQPARGLTALVVEDDDNERSLLAGVLGMHGCECVTAADGEEALAVLADRGRPDVVLLDMCMPRRDGPGTLRAIRADRRFDGLKVFSVSSTAPEDVGLSCGPGGLDAWFPKPLDPAQLCEAVRKAVAPSAN